MSTIEGHADVSAQLFDQVAPPGLDAILAAEFAKDYDQKLESAILNGAGTGTTLKGLLNLGSSIVAVTYTDGSPTGGKFYQALAQGYGQLGDARLLPPEAILLAPRRWAWLAGSFDNNNRPLFTPGAAAMPDAPIAGGSRPVDILGLPGYVDGAIPLTLGAGANEDRALLVRPSDMLLFECEPTVRVMRQVLSGTLQVRVQLYSYCGFIGDRFASATAVVAGTGMVAPSGY
jgi:HK97 family phage major capsid protein